MDLIEMLRQVEQVDATGRKALMALMVALIGNIAREHKEGGKYLNNLRDDALHALGSFKTTQPETADDLKVREDAKVAIAAICSAAQRLVPPDQR